MPVIDSPVIRPAVTRPARGLVAAQSPAQSASSLHSGVRFGVAPAADPSASRIPNNIYRLFLAAPKNEIHVHQSGSSSLPFLSYSLRKAIEQGEIQELPYYQSVGRTPEMVQFKDAQGQLLPPEARREAMEKVLTLDNLREYFRFQLEEDNQKRYLPSGYLAETTAKPDLSGQKVPALNELREQGLNSYRKTSVKINPYVKNVPAAYKLANEYARSMAFENVRYTEYRVSPGGNGLGSNYSKGIEDVLSAVNSGFKDAQDDLKQRLYKLDYGLLVLFERQPRSGESPESKVERAIQMAKDVVRLKKEHKYNIVGVDLAGDEANNPVTEFKEAFDIIKAYNADPATPPEDRLGITIHAGETPESNNPNKDIHLPGWKSIAQSIAVASDPKAIAKGQKPMVRIGHGLQLVNSSPALSEAFKTYVEHPKDWEKRINIKAIKAATPLLSHVIDNEIVLEMCPKSNLQTYGIYPSFPDDPSLVPSDQYTATAYKHHPAVFLSRLGVKIAISSDNRTISNTDATNEFVKLFKYAGLTYRDFKKIIINGFEGAFVADPHKKAEILHDVQRQFAAVERNPAHIKAIQAMGEKLSFYQTVILQMAELTERVRKALASFLEWLQPNPTSVRANRTEIQAG